MRAKSASGFQVENVVAINRSSRSLWVCRNLRRISIGSIWMLAAILFQLVALFAYGNNASSLAIWSVAAVFMLGVLSILTIFFSGVALSIARIKHTNLIRKARAHLCPACCYDLNGRDPSDDHCPECGFVAPKRECERLWCKLLRSRI